MSRVGRRVAVGMIVRISLCGLLACVSVGQLYAAGAPARVVPPRVAPTGAAVDWPVHGGDRDETGYSRLDAINATSVRRLGLAWAMDLPGETTLEATPLVIYNVP